MIMHNTILHKVIPAICGLLLFFAAPQFSCFVELPISSGSEIGISLAAAPQHTMNGSRDCCKSDGTTCSGECSADQLDQSDQAVQAVQAAVSAKSNVQSNSSISAASCACAQPPLFIAESSSLKTNDSMPVISASIHRSSLFQATGTTRAQLHLVALRNDELKSSKIYLINRALLI